MTQLNPGTAITAESVGLEGERYVNDRLDLTDPISLGVFIGKSLASFVSRNNMPEISGDDRKRIPEHERRRFDPACRRVAEQIIAFRLSPEPVKAEQPVEGEAWYPIREVPRGAPGMMINVRSADTWRWLPYSGKSEQFRKGIKGRWQRATEYGFENAKLPTEGADWTPVMVTTGGVATPAAPIPSNQPVEDLAGKLTAIRDKFLIPTPDKDFTDYAIITRCIEALSRTGAGR